VLVSAGVCRPGFSEKILLDQLAPGGILVYPEARGNLYRLRKLPDGGVGRDRWGGVAFVELKGRNA
jgi:protein-L-isoaspartate O-methyltransferase